MFHYLSFRFRIAALVINHVKYTWDISGPEKEMARPVRRSYRVGFTPIYPDPNPRSDVRERVVVLLTLEI